MITQNIYLKDWDWYVKVYYAVDTVYMDEVLGELESIGCTDDVLYDTENVLIKENTGMTYSNLKSRCSIVVIGLTSSPAEFQNTFDHEKGHLAMHIAEALDIDVFGEEFEYLTGEIGQKMFKCAKPFLCEHCREKIGCKIGRV